MTMSFAGVMVPLTTPFRVDNGEVDYDALCANTEALLRFGANGVLAAGSTGEAPLLSDAEAKSVVRHLRAVVPAGRPLIVGAGRESTIATVAACRDGAEAGADAALIRAPSYFASALTEGALVDHFSRVADESPIPVLLYNMPKYTHTNFSPGLIATMTRHPNVVGAKDSSGKLDNFKAYRDAAPDWALLVGSGAALLGALELGAAGGIVAVANFACGLAVAVAAACDRSDPETAAAAQERLGSLHQEVVGRYGPAGVKAAMDAVGLAGGRVRAPLQDLQDSQREQIVGMVRELTEAPV